MKIWYKIIREPSIQELRDLSEQTGKLTLETRNGTLTMSREILFPTRAPKPHTESTLSKAVRARRTNVDNITLRPFLKL